MTQFAANSFLSSQYGIANYLLCFKITQMHTYNPQQTKIQSNSVVQTKHTLCANTKHAFNIFVLDTYNEGLFVMKIASGIKLL